MIPKSLEPLLSRMKIPHEDDDIYEKERRRQIAPTIIKLIEEGGIGEGLVRKFKKDGVLSQELLEEFIIRAAICIKTPNKEKRNANWAKYINERFEEIYWGAGGILEIDSMCNDGMFQVCKGAKTTKQIHKVKNELDKLENIYLSKLNVTVNPDALDMLINLFNEYLPELEETSKAKVISKMLKPFGKEINPGSIRVRKYRNKKDEKWYFQKINNSKHRTEVIVGVEELCAKVREIVCGPNADRLREFIDSLYREGGQPE